MIDISAEKFDGCRRIYLAANTPSFLIRRMRTERAVIDLHLKSATDALLDELRTAVAGPINSFDDKVRPMILLASLSFKGDPTIFSEFEDFSGQRWVSSVAKFLKRFVRPTYKSQIDFSDISIGSISAASKSRTSNSRSLLEL